MAAGPSFRLLGVPVRIDLTFFVVAALLGFTGDLMFLLIWVAVVTVSVLLHELGHAVAFRAFGRQPQILLQGMGGLTSAPGTLPPGRDLVVSLAGPLTGLILIGLPALWLESQVPSSASDWDLALRIIVFVNIAWSVVNLLPVLPLDGGRVTASALHLVLRRRADRAAHLVSVAVAGVAAVWAYVEGQPFAALFAAFFVFYNVAQLSQIRARGQTEQLVDGYRALLDGDPAGALESARTLAGSASSSATVSRARELEAWAHLRRGQPAEAEAAIERVPSRGAPNPLLTASVDLVAGRTPAGLDGLVAAFGRDRDPGPWNLVAATVIADAGVLDDLVARLTTEDGVASLQRLQSQLHHAGRYRESVYAGQRAFPITVGSSSPDAGHIAYNVACSLARAGDSAESLQWLERAVEHGFTDRDLVDHDPDLETVRGTAGFEAVRDRLG